MSLKPSKSFLKVVGLLVLFSTAPGTIYLLYNRTGGPESKKEMGFQRNLRYALMAGTDVVDMRPLTEWPWIKVCALDAKITSAEVNDIVGFAYKDYGQLHWLPVDNFWTLLFIDSEREANWGLARPVTPVRVPRHELADLALPSGQKGACLNVGETFQITRKDAPVGISPVTLSVAP